MHRTRTAALALLVGLALTLGVVGFAAAEPPAPMSAEGTRRTMVAYVEELLSGGSYETYFADGVVVSMVGTDQQATGSAAAKQAIDDLHYVAFDAYPVLEGLIAGEGQAAIEARFVGTHTGEFAGIAPTGKDVDVPYSVFYELVDGEITALRIYGLADGLVRQLQAEPVEQPLPRYPRTKR